MSKHSKKTSATTDLIKQWAVESSPTRALFFEKDRMAEHALNSIAKKFLDFSQEDLQAVVKTFILDKKDLESASKEEIINFSIFALVELARYITPEDNNIFVINALLKLKKNSLVSKLVTSFVKFKSHSIKEGFLNLPESGVFAAPNQLNRLSYVVPLSPKEMIVIYIGKSPIAAYTDEDLVRFSFATPAHALVVHESHKEMTAQQIKEQQEENEGVVGNWAQQLEEATVLPELVTNFISNHPSLKNNSFIQKPLEMALNLWK